MKTASDCLQYVFSRAILAVALLLGFAVLLPQSILAQSGVYDRYDVKVEVLNDSSMMVTESIEITFNGTFSFVTRDIPLVDTEKSQICEKSDSIQCGGFSYIQWIELRNQAGEIVPDNQYTFTRSESDTNLDLNLKWTFAEDGREFVNEKFKYTLKYQVFGAIGYFDNYDLFYWNMLPADRPASITESSMQIIFPKDIALTDSDISVPVATYDYAIDYSKKYNSISKAVEIETGVIPASQNFTVLIKFPKGVVEQPGTIKFISNKTPLDVEMDGVLINDVGELLTGVVPGKHTLKISVGSFDSYKYDSIVKDVEVKAGETTEVEFRFQESPVWAILNTLNIICGVLGCFIFPAGLIFLYMKWRARGRDKGRRATIVPMYSPPENMHPYLLGSLKDESVDTADISGTIIDLAYRGYIKIREFKTGKILGLGGSYDYEFIKQKDFNTGTTDTESQLLQDIFGTKERVVMSTDLKEKFYVKLPSLKTMIYEEMTKAKYFTENPDKVRGKYTLTGTALVTIAVILLFSIGMFGFVVYVVITAIISCILLGIAFLIFAQYMPAKTELGSKALEHILGFKMYMEIAERFRVQNLTPETFEKYLSYAVVFGIEKQWADKFKDIYKNKPEWFDTDRNELWNAYILSNALRSFSTISANALAVRDQSSYRSSSSGWGSTGFGGGGGWSGGGGFSGGFSGGGGGGGGSGWG